MLIEIVHNVKAVPQQEAVITEVSVSEVAKKSSSTPLLSVKAPTQSIGFYSPIMMLNVLLLLSAKYWTVRRTVYCQGTLLREWML